MIWVMKGSLYFRGHGTSLDSTDTPTINKIIVDPSNEKIIVPEKKTSQESLNPFGLWLALKKTHLTFWLVLTSL